MTQHTDEVEPTVERISGKPGHPLSLSPGPLNSSTSRSFFVTSTWSTQSTVHRETPVDEIGSRGQVDICLEELHKTLPIEAVTYTLIRM
jgi:hypothetical protein